MYSAQFSKDWISVPIMETAQLYENNNGAL